MAVNALEKSSGKTSDKIRYISWVYNSVEREIGERIGKRDKEREGKEIGEPAGIAFLMSNKHVAYCTLCVFLFVACISSEMVFNEKVLLINFSFFKKRILNVYF